MQKKIEVLNEFDFEKTIKQSKRPVLVDFYAVWCTPCKMQDGIIKDLYSTLSDKIDFYKVNIDESESLCQKLNIESIPYLAVYYKGELKEVSVGLTSYANLSAMLIRYV